jgi:teichuronic acid biosynthesis glycosyltransferase TuaC
LAGYLWLNCNENTIGAGSIRKHLPFIRPMKALIITNAFPNSAEKTRGVFTYQIVKALQKKCDVEIVAPLPWFPLFLRNIGVVRHAYAEVPVKETIGGVVVHHPRYLVVPKVLGFLHSIFLFFPLLKLVKKIDKHKKIDLINSHWVFPDGVAAALVSKRLCKPIVLTALGCDINLYSTMMLRKIQISRALKMANFITVVSSNLKDTIMAMDTPEKKVKVIPNGVDLNLFRVMEKIEARIKLEIPTNRPILLTVGSQDEVKGTKYLIEAFSMVLERIQPPPLLICIGEGPLRASLLTQTKDLGIADNVLFIDKRPHDEIPLWMNAADVFCLPSLREGNPNVVIEALACGIPVVASNVGSIPNTINASNGSISNVKDTQSIFYKLLFCLDNKWDRMKIRSSVAEYNWEDCANKYFQTYSSIMSSHPTFVTQKEPGIDIF